MPGGPEASPADEDEVTGVACACHVPGAPGETSPRAWWLGLAALVMAAARRQPAARRMRRAANASPIAPSATPNTPSLVSHIWEAARPREAPLWEIISGM